MTLLGLVLAFVTAAGAVSLHRPQSQQELASLDDAKKHIRAVTVDIPAQIFKQQERQDKLQRDVDASDADKAKVEAAIKQLELQRVAEGDEAIQSIVRAYGISPDKARGTLVAGPIKGMRAEWKPIAGKLEPRMALAANGESIPLVPFDPNDAAEMFSDGQIVVTLRSFYSGPNRPVSPAFLASIIVHETVHFDQLTTEGRGGRMTQMRAEFEAFSAQTSKELGLTRVEVEAINDVQTRELARISNFGNGSRPFVGVAGPGTPDDLDHLKQSASDNFLRSWSSEGSPISSEMHDRLAESQRIRQQEAEKRRRMEPLPKGPGWQELEDWASHACHYLAPPEYVRTPSFPSPDELSYMQWAQRENDSRAEAKHRSDAYDRQYLLDHSAVIEKAEIERLLSQDGDRLDACKRDVIGIFQKADGPIETSWLVGQFDYRKGGGALGVIVRGLADAVSSGAAVIAQGISAPFVALGQAVTSIQWVADNSSQPSNSSQERSNDERPERSSSALGGASYNHCIDPGNTCLH